MSRRLKLAAVALVLCPPLLTGCFADRTPDAQQAYAPSDGVMGNSGPIRVLNAIVVAGEDAADGVVSMTVVNRGNEREQLTAIESDAGTVEMSGSREIAPNSSLTLGAGAGANAGAGTATTATIRGLEADPGESVSLTLRFEGVDTIRLRTLVVLAQGEYETITPSPSASPTAASPSPSPSEAAS